MLRHVLGALTIIVVLAATPVTALGDGVSGPGVMQGGGGIERDGIRYVAVPAGGWTALQAIQRSNGHVIRFFALKGSWGIPLVAFDGTTDGLMRYGDTLVLGDGMGGQKQSSAFAFVDHRRMKLISKIRLRGDLSFDALGPDGKYLFLVEHLPGNTATRYRVRAYDLRAERLLPNAVIDKREWETTMQGWPVSRATSRDGTWAYTLYGGTAHHLFIHALDTRNATAICIDLPWKQQPKRFFEFRLRLDGNGRLVVRGPHGRSLAVVDRSGHRLVSSVRNP